MRGSWDSTVKKISRAKEIYKEDGFRTLSDKSEKFLIKKITDPLAEMFILPGYHEYILRAEDVRQQATQFWDLKYGKKLSVQNQRDLIPFAKNDQLRFRDLPTYTFEDPFVAEIQNAHIIGHNPLPLTVDGKIVSDIVYFDTNSVGENRIYRKIKSAINDSPIRTVRALKTGSVEYNSSNVSTASLIYYPTNNFYHWMIEELPKLRGIEKYEKMTGKDVKLIIPNSPPKFVFEALDILGRDNYIEWGGGPLSVDHLIVPSYPQPYLTTLKWLQDGLESKTVQSPIKSDWIYISRQRAGKGRQVDNFNKIMEVLEEYGVEPVFLEDLNLQEEIATFQQVDGVIGPHGAGLVGMIWAEDLSIIEIFNDVINAPFYVLADILGHNYAALTGKGIGRDIQKKDQNIIVDENELRYLLENNMCD